MLRLVSISLVAGALFAAMPASAQESAPAQQPAPAPAEQPAPAPAQQPALAPAQEASPAPAQESSPAQAQEGGQIGNQFCNKDLQPMIDRRTKIAMALQAINKRGRPKTFEQAKKTFNEFCGNLSSYIENDKKMLAYMQSNKEFCSITDANVAQISADLNQTVKTKAKVCSHPPRQQVAPAPGHGGGGPAAPKPPVNLRLQ
ncbi:hypothetical protein [Labrys neptuniae]